MNEITVVDELVVENAAKWIGESWTSTINSILETGRRLAETKADFDRRFGKNAGEWSCLIGAGQWKGHGKLPFSFKQAYNLMLVANAGPALLNAVQSMDQLPTDVTTLSYLSKLATNAPERLATMVEEGKVTPNMKRSEAAAETRADRKAKDETRVLNIQPVQGRFRTLVLDPPWEDIGGPDSAGLLGRAAPDYATMNQQQLLAMAPQIRAWLEPESHVYLWTINNRIVDAFELARFWGLDVKALVTWCKPVMGLGSTFRNATEHFLFCSTGGLASRATDIPTWFTAAPSRGEHSAKPKAFYEIVRRMSYPTFGECFQRSGEPDFQNTYQAAQPATAWAAPVHGVPAQAVGFGGLVLSG